MNGKLYSWTLAVFSQGSVALDFSGGGRFICIFFRNLILANYVVMSLYIMLHLYLTFLAFSLPQSKSWPHYGLCSTDLSSPYSSVSFQNADCVHAVVYNHDLLHLPLGRCPDEVRKTISFSIHFLIVCPQYDSFLFLTSPTNCLHL